MLTINKECVKANIVVSDWKEAITETGRLLLESGSISKNYITNMIKTVEDLGPYIVISPGIAIAHAKPGNDVLRNDISITTLKDSVYFNCENDPVRIMICLAAKDGNTHMNLLQELVWLLNEVEKEKFINCKDDEELLRLIKKQQA